MVFSGDIQVASEHYFHIAIFQLQNHGVAILGLSFVGKEPQQTAMGGSWLRHRTERANHKLLILFVTGKETIRSTKHTNVSNATVLKCRLQQVWVQRSAHLGRIIEDWLQRLLIYYHARQAFHAI